MRARLFHSVEQMASPQGLTSIAGSPVASVEREPFASDGFSGSTLERVQATNGEAVLRFVLKHFSAERDWIMRATHDQQVREVALFRGGVFARMPDLCIVPTVAAAPEGASWASLMVDVSDSLLPPGDAPVPTDDVRRMLDHLAALHGRFMEDESLQNPTLGLCALRDWIMMLSPAVGQRETASGQANAVTGSLVQGWEAFAEEASPGAVQVVQRVQRDLRPLLRALARAPRTLLHGDYKFGNLGTWRPTPPDSASELHARNDTPRERTKAEDGALRQAQDADATPPPPVEPRTLMLDWGLAGFGAPLLDLAWFLAVNSARLPVSKEDAIEMYHESLASFGYPYQPHAWARDLDVALLAGGVLRLGWAKALGARADDPAVRERESAEVRWWSECAARAGRWLA